MANFFDADKFLFVENDNGHLGPVHYRDLGPKEVGALYKKSVTWSDVAINNVPLEQTFRYEDEIAYISEQMDPETVLPEPITINSRENVNRNVFHEDIDDMQPKNWLKRLNKMAQTLPEAKKKKKGPVRFQVKPKRYFHVEQSLSQSDQFHDMVNTQSDGITEDHIYHISPIYKKGTTVFIPPINWLHPIVQWHKIWKEIDRIYTGAVLDYFPLGEDEYEYDEQCDGLYFPSQYTRDVCSRERYYYKDAPTWLSTKSLISRAKKAYIKNPTSKHFDKYQRYWRFGQHDVSWSCSCAKCRSPYYLSENNMMTVPSPHL